MIVRRQCIIRYSRVLAIQPCYQPERLLNFGNGNPVTVASTTKTTRADKNIIHLWHSGSQTFLIHAFLKIENLAQDSHESILNNKFHSNRSTIV